MAIDAEIGTMTAYASAAFGLYFLAVKTTFTDLPTKRLAWVMPIASSLTLGVLSLYELWRLQQADFDLGRVAFTDSAVSRLAASIFLASLLTDCFFGSLFYLDQFDPLSGWFHHAFYVGATLYALHGGFTAGVIVFMANEFPTFILALGTVVPSLRNDLGFGLSFLATRVMYHGWLTVKTLMLKNPPYEVRWCVVLPMILHVWWFHAWCKGQMKRMKKSAAAEGKGEHQPSAAGETEKKVA